MTAPGHPERCTSTSEGWQDAWDDPSPVLLQLPPPVLRVAPAQASQDPAFVHPLPLLQQARTVSGFEPEGINLILWGPTSVLVSWSTGGERLRSTCVGRQMLLPLHVAEYPATVS